MRHLITCMGEILVDFLPMAEGGRVVGFRRYAGGSPCNVALGLARLGQPVALASKVSSDLFGRFLSGRVQGEGIDTRFLLPSAAPSTLAFVELIAGEPSYAFYGEGAADTLLTADDLPAALFEETAILQFGSISLLRGTTPAAVLATAERLKDRALLVFDPNIRPGLVRDEAGYRALLDRLFALADIVKVSTQDLAWWAREGEAAGLARLLRTDPALLVLTRGSQGVRAMRGDETWTVPAVPVAVADTVGAGDAFTAGLLASLAERSIYARRDLQELDSAQLNACLRFAVAAAALACTRSGADPPARAEVVRLLGVR